MSVNAVLDRQYDLSYTTILKICLFYSQGVPRKMFFLQFHSSRKEYMVCKPLIGQERLKQLIQPVPQPKQPVT